MRAQDKECSNYYRTCTGGGPRGSYPARARSPIIGLIATGPEGRARGANVRPKGRWAGGIDERRKDCEGRERIRVGPLSGPVDRNICLWHKSALVRWQRENGRTGSELNRPGAGPKRGKTAFLGPPQINSAAENDRVFTRPKHPNSRLLHTCRLLLSLRIAWFTVHLVYVSKIDIRGTRVCVPNEPNACLGYSRSGR